MFISLLDTKPTFAQLEGKSLPSVSARVEMSSIQKCAHVMYKHFVAGHGQLCACAFPFHQLEKQTARREFIISATDMQSQLHTFVSCIHPPCSLVLCIIRGKAAFTVNELMSHSNPSVCVCVCVCLNIKWPHQH